MLATNAKQRKLGIPELVSPRDYEEFFNGPGKLKPRPTVPDAPRFPGYDPDAPKARVKDTAPKPKWPVLADQSWKGKAVKDMTARERNAYIDQAHKGSAELADARAVGWGEFFRTLVKRKR